MVREPLVSPAVRVEIVSGSRSKPWWPDGSWPRTPVVTVTAPQTATALHLDPPQPRRGFSAPPTLASLARVRLARAGRSGERTRTMHRPQVNADAPRAIRTRGDSPAPDRTRAAGDRHRAVVERQRDPARRSPRQQPGRDGEYERTGLQACSDPPDRVHIVRGGSPRL